MSEACDGGGGDGRIEKEGFQRPSPPPNPSARGATTTTTTTTTTITTTTTTTTTLLLLLLLLLLPPPPHHHRPTHGEEFIVLVEDSVDLFCVQNLPPIVVIICDNVCW